jgi:predicted component of type VI protein secretion system
MSEELTLVSNNLDFQKTYKDRLVSLKSELSTDPKKYLEDKLKSLTARINRQKTLPQVKAKNGNISMLEHLTNLKEKIEKDSKSFVSDEVVKIDTKISGITAEVCKLEQEKIDLEQKELTDVG